MPALRNRPYSINDLKNEPQNVRNVWVINITKNSSRVMFQIDTSSKEPRVIQVPYTWVPFDLSEQADRQYFENSDEFRRCLTRNQLKLISPDEAQHIFDNDDEAYPESENARALLYDTNMPAIKTNETSNTSPIQDLLNEASRRITEAATKTNPNSDPELDDINLRVIGLIGNGDLNPTDAYSLIRNMAPNLNKRDWNYLNRNLNSSARNEKINDFITKQFNSARKE